MFDIGWSEMLLIIVVMIIVIGPKELPRALHTLGQWVGKVRGMARQFQDSIEHMAHQSGLDDVRKEISNLNDINFENQIEKTIDEKGEMRDAFNIKPPDFNTPLEDKSAPPKNADQSDKTDTGDIGDKGKPA